MLNAQQPFGADVISRISATMLDPDALAQLRQHAHETLEQLTAEVCEEAGVDPGEVYEIVVAGNVTMIQLALGIDPQPLSMAPFTITARTLPEAKASDFGVHVHPRAPAVLFPALGAYVGPDIVAGVLATGPDARPAGAPLHRRRHELRDRARLVRARAGDVPRPPGPAFEAAQIRCGMRAAEGAIEGVKIRDGEVELTVIGDVDAGRVSAARGSSTRSPSSSAPGSSTTPAASCSARRSGSARSARRTSSTSADDVFLSQRDVRELQFAKASIATGWTILCNDMGIAPEEISQVLLGGSFGSYLTPASAVKIGLVPKLPLARIVAAGNVAGEGAKIAALSVTERAAAHAVLDEIQYVELSGRTDFNDLFVDQLSFPA